MVETLSWVSIPVLDVGEKMRFDASAYDFNGREAARLLQETNFSILKLKNFVEGCFYPKRFKRDYVSSDSPKAIGFLGSSEMLDVNPKPLKYL